MFIDCKWVLLTIETLEYEISGTEGVLCRCSAILIAYQLGSDFRRRPGLSVLYVTHKMPGSGEQLSWQGVCFLDYMVGSCSHLCFWRILKVRLKMLQLFCFADCNSEGDGTDPSLRLSVSVLFSSTCWPAAVRDYFRFLCEEQCGNNDKSDLNWLPKGFVYKIEVFL